MPHELTNNKQQNELSPVGCFEEALWQDDIDSLADGRNVLDNLANAIMDEMRETKDDKHYLQLARILRETITDARKQTLAIYSIKAKTTKEREKTVFPSAWEDL